MQCKQLMLNAFSTIYYNYIAVKHLITRQSLVKEMCIWLQMTWIMKVESTCSWLQIAKKLYMRVMCVSVCIWSQQKSKPRLFH